MSAAAVDHVSDQAGGAFGHDGSDRSSPGERINRYGAWIGTCGENISYGKSTAREIVVALIVDDGQPARKHRQNIFNAAFNFAGAAVGPHARFGPFAASISLAVTLSAGRSPGRAFRGQLGGSRFSEAHPHSPRRDGGYKYRAPDHGQPRRSQIRDQSTARGRFSRVVSAGRARGRHGRGERRARLHGDQAVGLRRVGKHAARARRDVQGHRPSERLFPALHSAELSAKGSRARGRFREGMRGRHASSARSRTPMANWCRPAR